LAKEIVSQTISCLSLGKQDRENAAPENKGKIIKKIIMEDFKLNALKNNAKKTLTRAEMKNIIGGDNCGNVPPGGSCTSGWECQSGVCDHGICGWLAENCAGNGPCPPGTLCMMGMNGPYCV